MARRYDWAARINFDVTLRQLQTGKLPHGQLDPVAWAEIKRDVFSIPLLAEVIVAGFLQDEPLLLKASGKRDIESDADPPVFVIGSKGSRFAMEHLNRRGQNIHSSFAQTVLHIHEALNRAKEKDPDGYIGKCDGYIIMNKDRNGFEQFPHNCALVRGWAKVYAARPSTLSLKTDLANSQAEALIRTLQPSPQFKRKPRRIKPSGSRKSGLEQ